MLGSRTKIGLILITGIILISVAAIILYDGGVIAEPKGIWVQMAREKVDLECNSLCRDYRSGNASAGIDYCTKQYKLDFNENRNLSESFQTRYMGLACEDSFYCPHMHKCELNDGTVLSLAKCKQLLCDYGEERYAAIGDSNPKASSEREIKNWFKHGDCTIPEGQPDWYQINYGISPICP